MVLESHPYFRNATTVETISYFRTQMIDYLERHKVFITPGEEYGLTPPSPIQSRKHDSAPHLYPEWDEPCVPLSKDLKQVLQRSIGLHDGYSHHELSTAPTHAERSPSSPLLPQIEHQPPIGTSRPIPFSHTRSSLRNVTIPQAPIGSRRARTYRQNQSTPFMTASSSPLPPTSILGRYQAQRGSLLAGVQGRFAVDTEYGGYAAVDSTDSHERRHTAEFVRDDDEILSRPSTSRHINTWFGVSDDMAGVDSSIDNLDDNDSERLETPCSLVPSHDSISTLLHEDPFLFRALPDFQRRYTQDLVSDGDGLLAPPTRKNIFHPPQKDPLLSSQSSHIDDTHPHLQSPHSTHWSSTRAHSFKKHPIPIPSHNPFQHPQRHPNTHTLPTKQQPVPVPTRARQRNPWPSQPHILAPTPKVPNPNMVKYLENLVDDDIDIILYMSFQRSRSRSRSVNPDIDHSPNLPDHDDNERDQNQNQGVTHAGAGRNGYADSSQSQLGVVDRDGFERFLGERRRLSAPEAGAGTDEEEPTSDKGIFDDFPVCEMSIAMGLHDGIPCGRA